MLRNALRKELAELLAVPADSRPPLIRRSRLEAWLYATDLPLLCGGYVPETILNSLDDAGWEYMPEQEWLQLRKEASEPPEDWYSGTFGPEAACCGSLLDRHSAAVGGDPEAVQRKLIKAGEEGERSYEAACAALHCEWAERLRTGTGIPRLDRRYFGI